MQRRQGGTPGECAHTWRYAEEEERSTNRTRLLAFPTLPRTRPSHARPHSHVLCSPDEYPFTDISELPSPILKPFPHPPILHPNKINVNASILSFYIQAIVPRITRPATLALAAMKRAKGITGDDEYEDDGNYGSAAFVDLEVLQAISKRVHYGTGYLLP